MAFNNKKIIVVAALIFSQAYARAQDVKAADTSGFMRSEGKIYVAMTVAITILAGLLFFVWRLDRKITDMEKRS